MEDWRLGIVVWKIMSGAEAANGTAQIQVTSNFKPYLYFAVLKTLYTFWD